MISMSKYKRVRRLAKKYPKVFLIQPFGEGVHVEFYGQVLGIAGDFKKEMEVKFKGSKWTIQKGVGRVAVFSSKI